MVANGAQFGIPTVHYYWLGAIPAMVFLGIRVVPQLYQEVPLLVAAAAAAWRDRTAD